MITLRPDQQQLKQGIYDAWNAGANNVLAVLPTGGGKSVVVSDIVLDKFRLGASQCVIAHRTELVGQMSLHIGRRGIPHRIVAPKPTIGEITALHRGEFGRSLINPDAITAVGAVDTLIARRDALAPWAAQIDDWTIDEAHHVLRANKWGKAVAMFPNAKGLGVTASPARADGGGLGAHADGVFHQMIIGPDMRALINMGALCDYQIVAPKTDFEIDPNDVAPSGDWSPAKLREASKKSHIVGDAVTAYFQYAYGKRFICFATDVETAGDIAARFNAIGIPVAAVSAETPSDVRNEYIRRFRTGQLWGLVNVDLFGEGFDVPACEVVIMARPTASLAVYLQQFGRALRTLAGKLYGLVIDLVSNVIRHGLPDKPHYWTLDRREKRAKKEKDPEEIELSVCLNCSRPYERVLPVCPHCGTPKPIPDPSVRTLEKIDGDLTLLDIETLQRMRQATQLESAASLGQRVAAFAGTAAGIARVNSQIERITAQQRLKDAIAQWAGIQRYRGRPDAESYRRFYLTTGVDVLTAQTLPGDHMEALAQRVEGWCVL